MEKTNPLGDYPRVRKTLYQVYWLVGVVLGAIPVATAALPDATVPDWSLVAMAVFGYLGIAFGFTADQNTNPDDDVDDDEDYVETE